MFDISVEETTTVQSLIQLTIDLLRLEKPTLEISTQRSAMELYAARRSGRKISDLPSFESQQKILKTGERCFFLVI
jgi:hypothetical protein